RPRSRRRRRGRVRPDNRRPAGRRYDRAGGTLPGGPLPVGPLSVGTAVGHPAAGGDDRDPRRAQHQPGRAERGRRQPAAAAAGQPGRDRGTVRQVLPRHGARPLVNATDWATVASLATALGTLILAVATFSA